MAYQLAYSEVLNQDYRGHASQCSYTFAVNKPDQLGALWTAKEHLGAHIAALQEQGAIILEYYLWEDKAPTWRTDYYCRIVSSASPLIWWQIILFVVSLIGLVLVTTPLIKEIKDILEYGGKGLTSAMQWGALATIAIATVAGIYLVKRRPKKEA